MTAAITHFSSQFNFLQHRGILTVSVMDFRLSLWILYSKLKVDKGYSYWQYQYELYMCLISGRNALLETITSLLWISHSRCRGLALRFCVNEDDG
ncbi:hypothetical protein PanWU01x14_355430 [Parasponia andersonii]|uniref:Uncharacterized protein n=1 Tax=Parasponia andersonii TaxID=3476 RepID=A0A2P5A969_PARAD|nr:hypothetical protein PanWU01x14_355430 [Parasponia andersonii]